MKSPILLLTVLSTLSLAFPTPGYTPSTSKDTHSKDVEKASSQGKCVNPAEAQKFVDRYIAFFTRSASDLGDAKATGEALIADDIKQFSFSIKSLQGQTVTNGNDANAGLVVSGKENFINNILTNPRIGPPKGIKTLSALAACEDGESKIIWHYQFASVGEHGKYPIRGFTMFSVERDDGPGQFKVHRTDTEFDSVAWTLDQGGKVEGSEGQKGGSGSGHHH